MNGAHPKPDGACAAISESRANEDEEAAALPTMGQRKPKRGAKTAAEDNPHDHKELGQTPRPSSDCPNRPRFFRTGNVRNAPVAQIHAQEREPLQARHQPAPARNAADARAENTRAQGHGRPELRLISPSERSAQRRARGAVADPRHDGSRFRGVRGVPEQRRGQCSHGQDAPARRARPRQATIVTKRS